MMRGTTSFLTEIAEKQEIKIKSLTLYFKSSVLIKLRQLNYHRARNKFVRVSKKIEYGTLLQNYLSPQRNQGDLRKDTK